MKNLTLKNTISIVIGAFSLLFLFLFVFLLVFTSVLKKNKEKREEIEQHIVDVNEIANHILIFEFSDKNEYIEIFDDLEEMQKNKVFSEEQVNLIQTKISEILEIEKENKSTHHKLDSVIKSSINQSNNYIESVSQRLIEGKNVSVLEKQVIVGALKNTTYNYEIRAMFDEVLADEISFSKIVNSLNILLENIDNDIISLRNTQFSQLPVNAKKSTSQILSLSKKYIENKASQDKMYKDLKKEVYNILDKFSKDSKVKQEEIFKAIRTSFIFLFISLFIVLVPVSLFISFTFIKIKKQIGGEPKDVGQMLVSVKDSVGILTQLALDANTTSENLSQNTNEQAATAEEVSSSMEEMLMTIEANAENAMQTEKISNEATMGLLQGDKSFNETINALISIADKITIITEIARKTDLLAINASIEAARAGEHGKGFSVVAYEIRKLAEQSSHAAKEINELSKKSVEIGKQASDMFNMIVPEIEKSNKLVSEITSSSKEQEINASQVTESVNQLSQTIQENTALSEELSTSSEVLAAQAKVLNSKVSEFEIKENNSSNKKDNFNSFINTNTQQNNNLEQEIKENSDFEKFN